MPRKYPKKIGKNQRKRFAALRRWKDCWLSDPARMEKARRKNVEKAHQYYRDLAENLRSAIAGWPQEMTSKDLKGLIISLLPGLGPGRTPKGYDWRSCRQRLTRLKLIEFNPFSRMWANRGSPMIAKPQDNGIHQPGDSQPETDIFSEL